MRANWGSYHCRGVLRWSPPGTGPHPAQRPWNPRREHSSALQKGKSAGNGGPPSRDHGPAELEEPLLGCPWQQAVIVRSGGPFQAGGSHCLMPPCPPPPPPAHISDLRFECGSHANQASRGGRGQSVRWGSGHRRRVWGRAAKAELGKGAPRGRSGGGNWRRRTPKVG